MRTSWKSGLAFALLGAILYAGLFYGAERLLYEKGRSNPFFKIEKLEAPSVDWVILGTSHAMPLDFGDVNAWLEKESGARILNLAAPGAGPLYSRFVLEHFLARHRAKGLLYVVDSFVFYSRTWNEERFADAKLLRRTPFEPMIARRLASYVAHDGVDPRALADYLTGFSKINNRERFDRDMWEGELQFGREYRPSASAVKKRIAYLYPDKTPEASRERYLAELGRTIDLARAAGLRVVVVKLPVPAQFGQALPQEAEFDAALRRTLDSRKLRLEDFSGAIPEPRFYFDSDHLNRAGLERLLAQRLRGLLADGAI